MAQRGAIHAIESALRWTAAPGCALPGPSRTRARAGRVRPPAAVPSAAWSRRVRSGCCRSGRPSPRPVSSMYLPSLVKAKYAAPSTAFGLSMPQKICTLPRKSLPRSQAVSRSGKRKHSADQRPPVVVAVLAGVPADRVGSNRLAVHFANVVAVVGVEGIDAAGGRHQRHDPRRLALARRFDVDRRSTRCGPGRCWSSRRCVARVRPHARGRSSACRASCPSGMMTT